MDTDRSDVAAYMQQVGTRARTAATGMAAASTAARNAALTALARLVPIKCPWCGHKKAVMRKPVAFRVCPRCKRHFPDPFTTKQK